MPYGTVKVDNVTFTNNSVDATTTFSGIYASITNNLTLSGTATAATFTGTTANFTNVNAQNISVTTSLSGLAITGGTAGFTTITGTTVTGTTANFVTISGTTVTGTTANFVTVSGTTVTGNTGQFTNLAGAAAGFTTVTGTTITGTTANFVSGVFTTRISGTTVTGTTASFTSGVFASLSGTTHTITSGVFALGTAALPSISFVSDPNTGVFSPGGDQLAVATNGTQRLTVDTAATTSTLPIVHPLGAVGTPSITFTGDLNTGFWSPTADTLAASTAGSERLRITSAGLVGIGTSSPDVGLHYRGDTPKLRIESSNTLDTTSGTEEIGRLEWEGFRNTNFNAAASIRARQDGTWSTITAWNSPAALEFWTQDNTGVQVTTPRMLIDSSGRVGIGTTSPTTKLDIYTDSATGTYVKVENTEGRLFAGVYGTGEGYLATETSDPLVLGTNGTERARIDTSGRLLVGTSSAGGTELIQVQGNTSSSTAPGGIALRRSSLTNTDDIGYLNWTNASGNVHAGIRAICDGTPGASDYPGALLFSTTADGASSPTERMRINSAGATKIFASTANVLGAGSNQAAGTTYYLFYGSNNASSTTTGTTCFLVFTNGNVQNTNNSYAGISDAKLKENIVDAASQWSDIKALQVRKYNFKEGQTHTQIGLIAQEVELVSPGLVTESPDRDEDGNDLGTVTKSVNYSVLYMKAVKALQEAMERIEQLETEMAAVKAQLS